MDRIRKEYKNGKEFLVTDFSDCNEDQMIQMVAQIRDLILNEDKQQLVLAIFNEKNFLTPKLMEYYRTEKTEATRLIRKQALVGFTGSKLWILKGYNLFAKRNIRPFNTTTEAIDYLVDDSRI